MLHQKIGLALARAVLHVTGNRDLAKASAALPLVAQRRLAISAHQEDGRFPCEILDDGWWVLRGPAEGLAGGLDRS